MLSAATARPPEANEPVRSATYSRMPSGSIAVGSRAAMPRARKLRSVAWARVRNVVRPVGAGEIA